MTKKRFSDSDFELESNIETADCCSVTEMNNTLGYLDIDSITAASNANNATESTSTKAPIDNSMSEIFDDGDNNNNKAQASYNSISIQPETNTDVVYVRRMGNELAPNNVLNNERINDEESSEYTQVRSNKCLCINGCYKCKCALMLTLVIVCIIAATMCFIAFAEVYRVLPVLDDEKSCNIGELLNNSALITKAELEGRMQAYLEKNKLLHAREKIFHVDSEDSVVSITYDEIHFGFMDFALQNSSSSHMRTRDAEGKSILNISVNIYGDGKIYYSFDEDYYGLNGSVLYMRMERSSDGDKVIIVFNNKMVASGFDVYLIKEKMYSDEEINLDDFVLKSDLNTSTPAINTSAFLGKAEYAEHISKYALKKDLEEYALKKDVLDKVEEAANGTNALVEKLAKHVNENIYTINDIDSFIEGFKHSNEELGAKCEELNNSILNQNLINKALIEELNESFNNEKDLINVMNESIIERVDSLERRKRDYDDLSLEEGDSIAKRSEIDDLSMVFNNKISNKIDEEKFKEEIAVVKNNTLNVLSNALEKNDEKIDLISSKLENIAERTENASIFVFHTEYDKDLKSIGDSIKILEKDYEEKINNVSDLVKSVNSTLELKAALDGNINEENIFDFIGDEYITRSKFDDYTKNALNESSVSQIIAEIFSGDENTINIINNVINNQITATGLATNSSVLELEKKVSNISDLHKADLNAIDEKISDLISKNTAQDALIKDVEKNIESISNEISEEEFNDDKNGVCISGVLNGETISITYKVDGENIINNDYILEIVDGNVMACKRGESHSCVELQNTTFQRKDYYTRDDINVIKKDYRRLDDLTYLDSTLVISSDLSVYAPLINDKGEEVLYNSALSEYCNTSFLNAKVENITALIDELANSVLDKDAFEERIGEYAFNNHSHANYVNQDDFTKELLEKQKNIDELEKFLDENYLNKSESEHFARQIFSEQYLNASMNDEMLNQINITINSMLEEEAKKGQYASKLEFDTLTKEVLYSKDLEGKLEEYISGQKAFDVNDLINDSLLVTVKAVKNIVDGLNSSNVIDDLEKKLDNFSEEYRRKDDLVYQNDSLALNSTLIRLEEEITTKIEEMSNLLTSNEENTALVNQSINSIIGEIVLINSSICTKDLVEEMLEENINSTKAEIAALDKGLEEKYLSKEDSKKYVLVDNVVEKIDETTDDEKILSAPGVQKLIEESKNNWTAEVMAAIMKRIVY